MDPESDSGRALDVGMTMPRLRDFPAILHRPKSGSDFLPVVDGLRFLAILPVVMQHLSERVIRIAEARHLATPRDYALINALPSGHLGVELFFVISGLIISYPFIRAYFQQMDMPSLKKFYLRRVTRLEPPYFIVMIACYLFVRLTGHIPEGTQAFARSNVSMELSLAASLSYMHGLLIGTTPKLNPPAWSLEIEIQFYIIAPLLLLAFFQLRRRSAIFAGTVIFMLCAVLLSNILWHLFSGWSEFIVTRFLHLFLAGMIVNLIAFSDLVPKRISTGFWDAGFAASVVILYLIDKQQYSIPFTLLQSISFILLFISALNGNVFRRFLSRPWIFAVGGMCYTIYLLHLPILHVLTGIVMRTTGLVSFMPGMIVSIFAVLPILFIASVVFYLLIEKPCMNPNWPVHLRRWMNRLTRPA